MPPTVHVQSLKDWHGVVLNQIENAIGIIHQSMFDNFGWERCNPDGAANAYGRLLEALGVGLSNKLVYATTNYDLIGESALDRLGPRADYGSRQAFAGPGVSSAVKLDVEHLVETVDG